MGAAYGTDLLDGLVPGDRMREQKIIESVLVEDLQRLMTRQKDDKKSESVDYDSLSVTEQATATAIASFIRVSERKRSTANAL